jgi:hypothetical protein
MPSDSKYAEKSGLVEVLVQHARDADAVALALLHLLDARLLPAVNACLGSGSAHSPA